MQPTRLASDEGMKYLYHRDAQLAPAHGVETADLTRSACQQAPQFALEIPKRFNCYLCSHLLTGWHYLPLHVKRPPRCSNPHDSGYPVVRLSISGEHARPASCKPATPKKSPLADKQEISVYVTPKLLHGSSSSDRKINQLWSKQSPSTNLRLQ